jgi:PhzF family phenazine biosynthesis protein
MMKLPIYQIDAFASEAFSGNPAAVVPLDEWLPGEQMQAIAQENNLSETAFFVAESGAYRIRWFTPLDEVDLCGHATLATAFVLFTELGWRGDMIRFLSRSGDLTVTGDGQSLTLDFPSQPPSPCAAPQTLVDGLGCQPAECLQGEDYLAVFESPDRIAAIEPDFALLARLDRRGVIVTAPASEQDFVSRFFAPALGVPEDPVTGSSFTQLAPYWSGRLGKRRMNARQVSQRGGDVVCELAGDRVLISGRAVKFLEGWIEL